MLLTASLNDIRHDFAFTFTGIYPLYKKVVCDLLILLINDFKFFLRKFST